MRAAFMIAAVAAIVLGQPIAKGVTTCANEKPAQCPEFFK